VKIARRAPACPYRPHRTRGEESHGPEPHARNLRSSRSTNRGTCRLSDCWRARNASKVARQNLIQHGLLGLARAIPIGPSNPAARYIRIRQAVHGKAALAGRLPRPAPFQPRTTSADLSKMLVNVTISSVFSTTSPTVANGIGERRPDRGRRARGRQMKASRGTTVPRPGFWDTSALLLLVRQQPKSQQACRAHRLYSSINAGDSCNSQRL
jgi:hypothetical protein